MLVWNVGDGRSTIEIKDLPSGHGYAIDIGQRVMPGWSVQADGRSAILELSEPVAPRSLYHVDLVDPGGQPGRTGEPPHRVAGLPEPALPRERTAPCRDYLTYPSPDGVPLHGLLYRPDRRTARCRPWCCCTAARKARSGRHSRS